MKGLERYYNLIKYEEYLDDLKGYQLEKPRATQSSFGCTYGYQECYSVAINQYKPARIISCLHGSDFGNEEITNL